MTHFTIDKLVSGGLLVNYNCTSRCDHCMFACSPQRDQAYMQPQTAESIFRTVKEMGCSKMHITGGEPFMNIDGLESILHKAKQENICIDYIETNASWYTSYEEAMQLLMRLKLAGVKMLLISISPFHNKYIPFNKVKGLIKACNNTGISIFMWSQEFYFDLATMEIDSTHTREDFEKQFGPSYFKQVPYRYWIHYAGRALSLYRNHRPAMTVESLLLSEPCHELKDNDKFTIDLYGNYIPGLCTGLAFHFNELGKPLHDKHYRIIHALATDGIRGLYEIGVQEFGFIPKDTYMNKCHLCTHVRQHIAFKKSGKHPDLAPLEFYHELNDLV